MESVLIALKKALELGVIGGSIMTMECLQRIGLYTSIPTV
jgi:hypothetical protein